MTSTDRDRAIILGGSIAGLLAARVLSETYAEVVVVDRDELSPDPAPRRGTPQSRHLHGLLARGHALLEEFFPGLTAELTAGGAQVGDMLADTRLCFGGHYFRQGASGLPALCVSRPALEAAVRRRVLALPPVRVLGRHDVAGVVAEGRRIVGARVVGRADGSAPEELPGDLVVDATGRGSRLPVWLEALGFPAPRQDRLAVGVGYASRRYRLHPDALGNDLVVISAPCAARPRGGGLSRIEDGNCLVTLMGVHGDHPPTDPEGFTRFAADLALPDLSRILAAAAPLDDPVAYRYPASRWCRYDRLDRFPSGLAVLGDAVCTLNPIYGQGMTVAALEADALRRQLAAGHPLLGHLRDTGRIAGAAWALARGADLSFPETPGRRTAADRFFGRYVGMLQAGAVRDEHLGRAFLRVTSLVDPPTALLRPAVVARALAAASPVGRSTARASRSGASWSAGSGTPRG
ncbi:FAD-dependent oxidoreductase [Kribbella sp. NPDC050124]|uniref:FAD-dependent oxidoreductase n=1 Tax=Kribbella sp. NPDC050124 TaxID=3364114 RepID=UPI00378D6DB0